MAEQSIKNLIQIRGDMVNMNYMQISDLSGIISNFKNGVNMEVSQHYFLAMESLSNVQKGEKINTDMIQSVGYDNAVTQLNSAKYFIKDMQTQLDKFSARIKEIEAMTPDASEVK